MAVGIGVHQQDDLVIAEAREVEICPDPASEGLHDVRQLLVVVHLLERGLLGIKDLAAKRKDGLERPVAALLGRSTGRVPLNDEEFALSAGSVDEQSASLPGRLRR
jgi:hypothetical protein